MATKINFFSRQGAFSAVPTTIMGLIQETVHVTAALSSLGKFRTRSNTALQWSTTTTYEGTANQRIFRVFSHILMERNGAPSFLIPWYVSRQTSSDRGNHNIGKRHAYYHEIYAFSMENAAPFRPVPRVSPGPGGTPPPNIPGKLRPPLDPCPPASEGGVHC